MIRQLSSFTLFLGLFFVFVTHSGCDEAEPAGPVTSQAVTVDPDYCEDQDPPAPLIDLTDINGKPDYCGIQRGLYDLSNGTNTMPPRHRAIGEFQRDLIQPIPNLPDDPIGKIVLLSIGMSNVSHEWCHNFHSGAPNQNPSQGCNDWSFIGQAADLTRNPNPNPNLFIVNGAKGGEPMENWDCQSDIDACEDNYSRVDDILDDFGATPAQVQVVWIKGNLAASACRKSMKGTVLDDSGPRCNPELPYGNEIDAIGAEIALGHVLRELKDRYPNLKLAFISSRIYAGWDNNQGLPLSASPEPYAFENGFAVKRLIDAQIQQLANPGSADDPQAGNLRLNQAPWVAWGPYLWDDEVFWERNFFSPDGVHPSPPDNSFSGDPNCLGTTGGAGRADCGEERVATKLLTFFQNSTFTDGWFLE